MGGERAWFPRAVGGVGRETCLGGQGCSQLKAALGLASEVAADPCAGLGLALIWTLVLLLAVLEVTEEEELFSKMMMKYWANFARNG